MSLNSGGFSTLRSAPMNTATQQGTTASVAQSGPNSHTRTNNNEQYSGDFNQNKHDASSKQGATTSRCSINGSNTPGLFVCMMRMRARARVCVCVCVCVSACECDTLYHDITSKPHVTFRHLQRFFLLTKPLGDFNTIHTSALAKLSSFFEAFTT